MDLSEYRVVARGDGANDFELIHEPTGARLMLTQNVSLQTLIYVATEDKELMP